MDLFPFLKLMVDSHGTDLFFSAATRPHLKIQGKTMPVNAPVLTPANIQVLAYSIMTEQQISEFEATQEMNLCASIEGIGRFRVNVYRQRGAPALVIRYIRSDIPRIVDLSLPPVLKDLIMLKRGLILVVGAAGSGKSTTMAAMIDYRNRKSAGHILCVEDPIEFIHSHKQSVVDQREVGIDTASYAVALKNAMREAPDVIAIGEIRDRETMQHAIHYAQTGHLCISTLHASNSNQALERIINFFPEEAHKLLLMDLSQHLQGVVGQRLVQGTAEKLMPAVEVMLASPLIKDLTLKGRVDEIKGVMARSTELGMQTFDQSLYDLYAAGKIPLTEALRNADSRTDLQLRINLARGARLPPRSLAIAPETQNYASSSEEPLPLLPEATQHAAPR